MLPQTPGEFRTQAYWSQFFEARGGRAFEWYASFADVRGEFQALCPLVGQDGSGEDSHAPPPVLVPGCGNSTISEDLWHAGYKSVHSIDFEPGVIASMAEKTRGSFPGLAWSVESVADLSPANFPTASFAAVLDKGLLDAMLPCVEEEGKGEAVALGLAQAEAYLEGCARVLAPTTGALFIVSLLQDHVLEFIFKHLESHRGAHPGWGALDIVRLERKGAGRKGEGEGKREDRSGGEGSSHCPFLLILKRSSSPHPFSKGEADRHSIPICVREGGGSAAASGPGPVTRHTLFSATAGANSSTGDKSRGGGKDASNAVALAGVRSSVRGYQWAMNLESVVHSGDGGGVFLTLDLWPREGKVGASGVGSVTPSGTPPSDLGYPATLSPRYSLTLVDCVSGKVAGGDIGGSSSSSSSGGIGNSRAVLLIPPGREHEYTFSTHAGLAGLGRGAGLSRLLGVARGVGEGNAAYFCTITQAAIQAELSPVVRTLLPSTATHSSSRQKGSSVPFLAVASEGGQFKPIAEGCSPMSGVYVVEEGEWDGEDDEGEGEGEREGGAGKVEDDDWGASSILPAKGKKAGKGGAKGKQQKGAGASNPPPHPITKPSPLPTTPSIRRLVFASNRAAVQTEVVVRGGVVDHRHTLRFSYHSVMAAALGRYALGGVSHSSSVKPTVVVVGLGGGALPSYLATTHKDAMQVVAIELDGDMVDCAVAHFGLPLCADKKPTPLSTLLLSPPKVGIDESALASLLSPGCVGVVVGDGVEFCAALGGAEGGRDDGGSPPPPSHAAAAPLALVIDVNAGREDLRTGLSFPPSAFVTPTLLAGMARGLLQEGDRGGLLIVNVGARSPEVLARVISQVASAFHTGSTIVCTEVDGEDTGINTVVIAGSRAVMEEVGGGDGKEMQQLHPPWVPKGWVCSRPKH